MQAPHTIKDPKNTAIVKDASIGISRTIASTWTPWGPTKTVRYCQRLVVHHSYTGCVDPEQWGKTMKEGKVNETPQYHSAFFGPAIQPTLQTAVDAFVVSALTYLQ